jgi:dienelactone hydrolase
MDSFGITMSGAMETGSLQLTAKGYQGQTVPYEVPFIAFPTTSGRLLIQAPGAGEVKEGAWNRYVRLGEHLQARNISSLVSFNPPWPDAQGKYPDEPYSYRDASWNRIFVEGMANLVAHCLANGESLCGTKEPEVYLAGFSAGGSVAVAVAPLFARISRILLVSAYDSAGWFFLHGLRHYAGDVYVAYAEDDIPAVALAMTLRSLARRVRAVSARGVPKCDHGFSGETNGKVFSKAYLWAFTGDESFPSPEGGIRLYDETVK